MNDGPGSQNPTTVTRTREGVSQFLTPREAVACFFNSGLDALVMGKYLLEKPASPVRSDA